MVDRQCQTCAHWNVFPENNLAGRCRILGAILWPKVDKIEDIVKPAADDEDMKLLAEISITSAGRLGETLHSQVIAVRTQKDFGCCYHKAR